MTIVATIEARMTSKRLPGKVLLPAAGKPMLEHLVDRLKVVSSVEEIILATTINNTDDVLVELAESLSIHSFRGDENDVMNRVIGAAESLDASIVVEITGDCPIIDPSIIEHTIQIFHANDTDYVSNAEVGSYPDGMDTQVFTLEALKKSASMTTDPLDKEHVTLHMRNHPEIFSHVYLVAPPDVYWPGLGLTLDEPNDYTLLKKLIEHFSPINPLFSCHDVVNLLRDNPHWVDINGSPHWVDINGSVIRRSDTR